LISKARDAVKENTENTQVKPANNFALVHTTGKNSVEKPGQDERFSISIDECIKIKRTVEMY